MPLVQHVAPSSLRSFMVKIRSPACHVGEAAVSLKNLDQFSQLVGDGRYEPIWKHVMESNFNGTNQYCTGKDFLADLEVLRPSDTDSNQERCLQFDPNEIVGIVRACAWAFAKYRLTPA